jgi:hypothetical protein
MSAPEYRSLSDEYGIITQRESARGGWVNVSRTMNGVTFMLDGSKRTVDYLLALQAGGVQLRLNEMNGRIEVWGGLDLLPNAPEPMSDIQQDVIINWLTDVGHMGQERMLRAISEAAASNAYHPIKDYLARLRWDGEDRLTAFLDHLTFNPSVGPVGRTFVRRWLIGAVAKVMEQGQNFMLVIDGNQGIGKSYLVRWLCPLPRFFLEGAIHPDDKDTYLRLMSNWIWEVGELEGTTRKADRAALKDFITRREVTIRLPYAKHDIVRPAAASLIGTINEDGAGFLNDPTGTRRFAVIKLDGIDFRYVTIDRDQLWAQVFTLYQDGEPWELTGDERQAQHAVNSHYESDSPVEQYLRKTFAWDKDASGRQEHFLPSLDIMQELKAAGLMGNERANMMEVSTVLKREGLHKARRGGLVGFYGVARRGTGVFMSANGSNAHAEPALLEL